MGIARCTALLVFAFSLLFGVSRMGAQAAPSVPPQPPPAQSGAPSAPQSTYTLPPDKLAKAKVLNEIRLILEIGGDLWALAVIWLLLATGSAAGLEHWAMRVAPRRWIQGFLFFAAFFVITALAALPLDAAGHIASRHFGISVQGWGGWLGDRGKALGLTILFGCLALLLFNWLVRVSPRRFWIWCWLVSLPLMVAGAVAEPLIEPMFDKFEPLAKTNPRLVSDLEKVVARTGTEIPPGRMYLMKASAKTNGLNAYVTGLGATKRIVVWDTTAGRIPNDQIMFIFAHETGHYVLRHIPKGLALSAVGSFFLFWGCALFAEWLGRRYGARWHIHTQPGFASGREIVPLATRAGFVILLFSVSIASFILAPVSNTVSRYFEHQADVYGQEAIHDLVPNPQRTAVAAFDSLGEAWLDDPDPSPFVEFWLYNHPSVKTRVNFAAHYDPWASGGHGEFFEQ